MGSHQGEPVEREEESLESYGRKRLQESPLGLLLSGRTRTPDYKIPEQLSNDLTILTSNATD